MERSESGGVDPRPTLASPVIVSDEGLAPSEDLSILIDRLDHHDTQDPSQLAIAQRMGDFARAHSDALFRTCPEAHFTGSALVVEEGTGDELELVPLDEGGDFCREMLPEEGGGVGRV